MSSPKSDMAKLTDELVGIWCSQAFPQFSNSQHSFLAKRFATTIINNFRKWIPPKTKPSTAATWWPCPSQLKPHQALTFSSASSSQKSGSDLVGFSSRKKKWQKIKRLSKTQTQSGRGWRYWVGVEAGGYVKVKEEKAEINIKGILAF